MTSLMPRAVGHVNIFVKNVAKPENHLCPRAGVWGYVGKHTFFTKILYWQGAVCPLTKIKGALPTRPLTKTG